MKKKIISLVLALSMVTGLVACGTTNSDPVSEESSNDVVESSTDNEVAESSSDSEDDSEEVQSFAGTTLRVTVNGYPTKIETVDDTFWPTQLAAISLAAQEWEAKNDATVEYSNVKNGDKLMAAIAAGEQPDVVFTSMQCENGADLGMGQPITEYYDYFKEKYGAACVDPYVYEGELYGVGAPVPYAYMLRYERSFFEERNMKTPAEYFLEGNWNWETFFNMLKEVTEDTNADGVNDIVGFSAYSWFGQSFCPAIAKDENGDLVSTLETDMSRDFYQYLYEGYTLDQTILNGLMTNPGKTADGIYVVFGQYGFDYGAGVSLPDMAAGYYEYVPIPYYKTEADAFISTNADSFMVITGADVAAAVSYIDTAMEVLLEYYDVMSYANENAYEYTPVTENCKKFFEVVNNIAQGGAEGFAAKCEAVPYFKEYCDKLDKYWKNTKNVGYINITGVDFTLTYPTNENYIPLFTQPSATSLAEIIPIVQSQLDTYAAVYGY